MAETIALKKSHGNNAQETDVNQSNALIVNLIFVALKDAMKKRYAINAIKDLDNAMIVVVNLEMNMIAIMVIYKIENVLNLILVIFD